MKATGLTYFPISPVPTLYALGSIPFVTSVGLCVKHIVTLAPETTLYYLVGVDRSARE